MWSTATISGKSVEVFDPSRRAGVVVYLHGYAGERLSEKLQWTSLFEEHGLAVVAPQGGHCWWQTAVCPEFDPEKSPLDFVSEDVVDWVENQWQVAPPHLALLGVSMGGQGALKLAYIAPQRFPVVAALSPALDFYQVYEKGFGLERIFPDQEAARQAAATLHLHPLNWPRHQFFASDPQDRFWHGGAEVLASKLRSTGIPFECDLETSHGGHGWEYFNAMAERAIGFIADGLQQVRRSLI